MGPTHKLGRQRFDRRAQAAQEIVEVAVAMTRLAGDGAASLLPAVGEVEDELSGLVRGAGGNVFCNNFKGVHGIPVRQRRTHGTRAPKGSSLKAGGESKIGRLSTLLIRKSGNARWHNFDSS